MSIEEKLLKKLDDINFTDEEFMKIVDKVNKGVVQASAKLNCPVKENGGGELRNSIQTSASVLGGMVTAETFTNKEHAGYVEFGTGPVGQEHHEGISPEVNPSYVQHGWGIPADKVDPADAELYKWPKRTYGGKDYYMTSGQPARPFMYPALKNNEKLVSDQVGKEIVKKLKKGAGK